MIIVHDVLHVQWSESTNAKEHSSSTYPQTPTAKLTQTDQQNSYSATNWKYKSHSTAFSMIVSIPLQPNMLRLNSPRHLKNQKSIPLPLSFSFTHISFCLIIRFSIRKPTPAILHHKLLVKLQSWHRLSILSKLLCKKHRTSP